MKQLIPHLKGLLPSRLPVGVTEFENWSKDIFDTYGLPNLPSYQQALASMIMHLGPTVDRKPKYYFAKAVRKAQANQIAYEQIQKLKKAEQEYIAATLAVAETPLEAVNDDKPIQE